MKPLPDETFVRAMYQMAETAAGTRIHIDVMLLQRLCEIAQKAIALEAPTKSGLARRKEIVNTDEPWLTFKLFQMAHGGKREGAGRKKGVPNKATADIKALAQAYGEDALSVLANLMHNAESEQARVSAAKELLDRGYGKPTQAISGEDGAPIKVEINWPLPMTQLDE